MNTWIVHEKERYTETVITNNNKLLKKINNKDILNKTTQLFTNNNANASVQTLLLKTSSQSSFSETRKGLQFNLFKHRFNFTRKSFAVQGSAKGIQLEVELKDKQTVARVLKELEKIRIDDQTTLHSYVNLAREKPKQVKIILQEEEAWVALSILNQFSPFSERMQLETSRWLFSIAQKELSENYITSLKLGLLVHNPFEKGIQQDKTNAEPYHNLRLC